MAASMDLGAYMDDFVDLYTLPNVATIISMETLLLLNVPHTH